MSSQATPSSGNSLEERALISSLDELQLPLGTQLQLARVAHEGLLTHKVAEEIINAIPAWHPHAAITLEGCKKVASIQLSPEQALELKSRMLQHGRPIPGTGH